MSESVCIHAIISGRVQGVYYRAWTVSAAKERGLTGWVRNRTDGSVEAVFCGPVGAVEDMLKACTDGPPSARVAHIERGLHDGPPPSDFRKLDTL